MYTQPWVKTKKNLCMPTAAQDLFLSIKSVNMYVHISYKFMYFYTCIRLTNFRKAIQLFIGWYAQHTQTNNPTNKSKEHQQIYISMYQNVSMYKTTHPYNVRLSMKNQVGASFGRSFSLSPKRQFWRQGECPLKSAKAAKDIQKKMHESRRSWPIHRYPYLSEI